jgi:hypothetical protein
VRCTRGDTGRNDCCAGGAPASNANGFRLAGGVVAEPLQSRRIEYVSGVAKVIYDVPRRLVSEVRVGEFGMRRAISRGSRCRAKGGDALGMRCTVSAAGGTVPGGDPTTASRLAAISAARCNNDRGDNDGDGESGSEPCGGAPRSDDASPGCNVTARSSPAGDIWRRIDGGSALAAETGLPAGAGVSRRCTGGGASVPAGVDVTVGASGAVASVVRRMIPAWSGGFRTSAGGGSGASRRRMGGVAVRSAVTSTGASVWADRAAR